MTSGIGVAGSMQSSIFANQPFWECKSSTVNF
jgi:hypothetical protein